MSLEMWCAHVHEAMTSHDATSDVTSLALEQRTVSRGHNRPRHHLTSYRPRRHGLCGLSAPKGAAPLTRKAGAWTAHQDRCHHLWMELAVKDLIPFLIFLNLCDSCAYGMGTGATSLGDREQSQQDSKENPNYNRNKA